MSLCLKCDAAKDNGEPFCFKCDPDGEMGKVLSSPEQKARWERAREQQALEARLDELKKDLQ